MKEVTQYQCEHCGTFYKEAAKARECEEFHILADTDSPIAYKYRAKNEGHESKYPYAVVITMANGEKLTFKR